MEEILVTVYCTMSYMHIGIKVYCVSVNKNGVYYTQLLHYWLLLLHRYDSRLTVYGYGCTCTMNLVVTMLTVVVACDMYTEKRKLRSTLGLL